MNTFEDPEWGNSDVFSYYNFPDDSDFKVSSSLLKTSLDLKKNSKVGGKKAQGNKKRKHPEEEPEQVDSNQKIKKPKRAKGKEAGVAGNVSEVKQKDTISPSNQESNAEKLTKTSSNLGNEEERATPVSLPHKKKKKNSNKRNKYKDLNTKQNEIKNGCVVNGEIKKCTPLPEKRSISKTVCDENLTNKELGQQGKGPSQNLELTAKSPLKPSKKKLKKGEGNVLKKVDAKIGQNENISVSNEPEAFVKSKGESVESSTGMSSKKKVKNASKLAPKDSKNSEIVNISNKKDSKSKLVVDDSEERSKVKTRGKKKKNKNSKDQLLLDDKESDDEEVDSKLKEDLEDYLKKLDFSKVMSGSVMCDTESSASMKTSLSGDFSVSDSEDEYVEDEMQEKKSSEQNVATNDKRAVGNNDKGKTNKISKGKILSVSGENNENPSHQHDFNLDEKKRNKLNKNILNNMLKESEEKAHKDLKSASGSPTLTAAEELKEKMKNQLNAARFRLVNEKMYTATSSEAATLFKSDRNSFEAYHTGFKSQVARWPVNPLDRIITWLKKKPNTLKIADFGCGEAVLAASVPQKNVHSFDLVALNPRVTVCDMAHTPLQSNSIDVAVFCLSLMGTNIRDFILEANRVLKKGGILKIAEVESRINKPKLFVDQVKKYGFNCTYSDTSTKYFFMFDFKKGFNVNKKDVPDIILKPCKYKKR
ncbi:ribosomal RNA-processing protein 8-like [Palaemon carinicauda]|uniref:ribosomal RNA-processing protein 8-like n=1 Tax=Palaemon carinicauda TaxID=392227 RepID=UPI0035B5F145